MNKKIVLTGGGTAGHVTPNLALVPALKEASFEIRYIGSYEGIESKLVPEAQIEYKGIATGKLRRYFDLKNFTDPFRVLKGISQAKKYLKEFKPDVVFSKGGFVGLPVVIAAHSVHIPVITHESDMTPGLANKLGLPYASKICCNFPETVNYLPKEKAVLTGSPIRKELIEGDKNKGLSICGFSKDKPVIMAIGGSLGAMSLNEAVRKILPELLEKYQIIHVCGKDKVDTALISLEDKGYKQFDYVNDELKDLFAAADIVISRAGANSICELLALKKPNILVPLSRGSRGDQILNAKSFEKQGYSVVLEDNEELAEKLLVSVESLFADKEKYISAMEKSTQNNAISTIISLIETEMK